MDDKEDTPGEMPPWLLGLTPLIVLFFGVSVFYGMDLWTGALTLFTHDIGFLDHWHFHMPLKKIYAEALATGQLPYWSSQLSTGFPLLAEGEVGALYPPNLALFSLFSLSQAMGISLLLHGIIAGLGAYALARNYSLSVGPALFCGLIFALSGFMITHAKHLNMIHAAVWLPWMLLEIRRVFSGEGSGVRLALWTTLSLLAGHPQITYYSVLSTCLMGLSFAPSKMAFSLWRRRMMRGSAAMLCALLLAAPQLIPTLELANESSRGDGMSWEEANAGSYSPAYLALFFDPLAFGDPAELVPDDTGGLRGFSPPEGTESLFWEVTGYVGILPWLLLIFLFRSRWARAAIPVALLALLSTLLALGDAGIIGEWAHHGIPGYSLFRFHSRWLLVIGLFLALLGGMGLQGFLDRIPGSERKWAPLVVAFILLVGWSDLYQSLGHHNPTVEPEIWLEAPASVTEINRLESDTHRLFRVVGVQGPEGQAFQPAYPVPGGSIGDLAPYPEIRSVSRPNLWSLYGINTLFTSFHLTPQRLQRGVETTLLPTGRMSPVQAGRLNVRYWVAAVPQDPQNPQENCFGGGPDACVRIFPNPDVQERFTLASFAHVVPPGPDSLDLALQRVVHPSFKAGRDVVLEGPGILSETNKEGALKGNIRLDSYSDREASLTVRVNRPAWLVTSDTYYPGWSAWVDGVEEPVYAANGSGRAILVPSGTHSVVWKFEPNGFQLALFFAVLGFLGVLLLGRFHHREALESA